MGWLKEARLQLVTEANASGLARLGWAEQARADAALIPPGFWAALQVAASDRSLAAVLAKQANRPLVSRFARLLPDPEQAALLDRQGRLSAAGQARLERALFASTFPGPAGERLTRLVFEEGVALERVGAGLRGALPHLGRLEDRVRSSQCARALSLGPDLAAAVEKMYDLRQRGVTVRDYLPQHKLFPELTALQQQWLVQLHRRRRSARAVAALVKAYAAAALKTPSPDQGALFGTPFTPLPETLLRTALKQVGGHWLETTTMTDEG